MNLNEMLQERAGVFNQLKEIQNRYNDKPMDGADKDTYGNLEAKFDELTASIDAENKKLARERQMGEQMKPEAKTDKGELFAKALTGNPDAVKEYRAAHSLGTDATAGYLTAPVEFVNKLIVGLNNDVFMRQLATIVGPIGQAQSLGFPTVATDAADVSWTGEITDAGEDATLAFGRREFKPNRLAKLVKVSKTLIRHAPNPDQTILDRIIYKVAMAQESAYMTGDGSSKPLGIFVANANGIDTDRDVSTGNTATTVTFDGLTEAKYAIKGQYMRNASWVMHRDLVKMISKIKDGEGQYIWQPSVQLGQPDRLIGAPVYMSEYAPNTMTTGKYVAVYGDFKNGYWVCDSDGLYITVLDQLYALGNQMGYVVEYFGDGAPVLPEAFARVKLG